MSAWSCDQLCQITADRIAEPVISILRGDMYTDHQCALMICVAPSVPPVSVHQCQLSVLIHATCQCPSVPHQCHISVPTSAHQCHKSVPI
ncbi:unnamed protein product [Staurois parvus]|uniref:Uncharacterized protein n=1 Tax=Staurois parvus TaxID=386267 RepID=A0ABN9AQP3_9NEOB|nr:unnamed protein product [Staurois parvus]